MAQYNSNSILKIPTKVLNTCFIVLVPNDLVEGFHYGNLTVGSFVYLTRWRGQLMSALAA